MPATGSTVRRVLGRLVVTVSFAAATLAVATASPNPANAAPPTGYTDVVVGTVASPVGVSRVSTTGDLLVIGQAGTLSLMTMAGAVRPLLTIADICAGGEQGLLGVTNDVGAASGSYVYLYATRRTVGGCVNRVSRFDWNATTINPATELVLIDNLDGFGSNHNGGDIQFGKDGNLYIAIGDGGCDSAGRCGGSNTAARNNSHLLGKIVRITRTGGIPVGNPYSGAGTVRCNTGGTTSGDRCQEIFSTGLRNPFRLGFDLNATGTRFYINDVGQGVWEEIDEGVAGADYGWNTREGSCATGSNTNCGVVPGLTNPVYAYEHGSGGCSSSVITGGAFAPPGWPTASGTYFYGEFSCNRIYQLTPNGSGGFTSSVFLDDVGSIVDLKSFDDGAMYYTDPGSDEVHRITFDGGAVIPGTGKFVPIVPTRVMDTRNSVGFSGIVGTNATVTLDVPDAVAPEGVVALAVNVTATGSTGAGFLTVWPSGTPKPGTSAVNYAAGETVANASILAAVPASKLNVFAAARTHVIIDVTGYWLGATESTSGRLTMVSTPKRILDTRGPVGVPTAGRVAAGGTVSVAVRGFGEVPSEASAVVATVTAANAGAAGFVTVWPSGVERPQASTLNPTRAGDVRANLVLVPIGADGKVSLYTSSAADLIFDVVGWFTNGSVRSSDVGLYQVVSPSRVVDTRSGNRQIANSTVVHGFGDKVNNVPLAIAYNLTATSTLASGYLTAFPASETTVPTASNVNASAPNQSRAALAITRGTASVAGVGGPYVKVFSSMPTHILIDVAGYFTSGSTS